MKFLYCTTGANHPAIREFDISTTAKVCEGEAVCAVSGVITGAITGGTALGISAENHPGEKDILDARANGRKLRVNATNGAVYAANANVLAANTAGSSTTFICSGTGLSTSAANGVLILVKKASGSTNTDKIGDRRSITSCAISSGTATFTIAAGGAPCVGDEYAFYPALGTEMCLDSAKTGVVLTNSATDLKFKVVGFNTDAGEVHVTMKNLLFA